MAELDSKVNLWIREHMIPRVAENEPNAKFTISRPTGSFFISDLFFVTVHVSKGGDKDITVVVKLPLANRDINMTVEYDDLSDNEVLFYKHISHISDVDYPKCYVAGDDPVFKNVTVLEDVRPRGYLVCQKKVNVDLEYIVSGLKAIGRFHGHTYTVKEKEPERFREITRSIRNTRYDKVKYDELLKSSMNRRVQLLLRAYRAKNGESEFLTKISKPLEDAFGNVIMKCVEPVEPLATVIHADCTINNMLYRKTKDGKLEAMLIDFGLLLHASPSIDIATFLYMTCKPEDIRDRIDELFNVYHDSLTKCLKEQGVWNAEKYSRQVFWQDYKEHAIFGYIAAAVFFRFVMIMCERDNKLPGFSDIMTDAFFESDEGPDFINTLINMLDDLRIAGMLDHLIENNKK